MKDMEKLNIAIVGFGMIGRRHMEILNASTQAQLSAIVDVAESSKKYARENKIRYFETLEELFKYHQPDGVILATPNALHVSGTLICAKNGVPALIEKPIADTVESGEYLVNKLEKYNIPMLVGHHRRHSVALQTARDYIRSGKLGKLVSVMGSAQFYKPDSYFEQGAWRKSKGGGTILINLIHEIDNLRFLCGEIVEVQAMASNAVRNFEVEDTAVMNFRFENGMLGTFTLSDTAVLPISWEQTSGENKAYAAPTNHGNTDCYFIAGTNGSIAVPSLKTWHYAEEKSWWQPLETNRIVFEEQDPLMAQLSHFCDVICRKTEPIVSPADALESLKIIERITENCKLKNTFDR